MERSDNCLLVVGCMQYAFSYRQGGSRMQKDIVEDYRKYILSPLEQLIKQQEEMVYKKSSSITDEQLMMLQETNALFLKKLETYILLCEEDSQV